MKFGTIVRPKHQNFDRYINIILSPNHQINQSFPCVFAQVQDQIPSIRKKHPYYTMSLRMMKSIWRHVRLRKGFVNLERAPFGGKKLRIPSLLYTEKMKTQSRLHVFSCPRLVVWIVGSLVPDCPHQSDPGRAEDPLPCFARHIAFTCRVQKMLYPVLLDMLPPHVQCSPTDQASSPARRCLHTSSSAPLTKPQARLDAASTRPVQPH